jgi:zinc-binding alcohol dehydrogenase family protein
MKAVGYKKPLPIADTDSLLDLILPEPETTGRDLLVEVKALSVNPVDTKFRANSAPVGSEYMVLGWDAAGIVRGVGPDVTLFKPGDEVFYAGSIVRPGTNAELHLVDERIVGRKPKSLSFAEAAALPLTSLTAWELLFERLNVRCGDAPNAEHLLIIVGAGGVGSIAIQIARKLTELTVIATASRPETQQWCLDLGAHYVIDNSRSIPDQIKALGLDGIRFIASLTATETHYPALVEVLAPQGRLGVIDDPNTLDVTRLKSKAASPRWESMFTRSLYSTADVEQQHRILNDVSALVDQGEVRTTEVFKQQT